jgi:hypothetical protein
VADVLTAAGAHRLLVVDPHTPALESMFAVPVEMLTALPVLVSALAGTVPDDAVVVTPDLGAVRLAERVAGALGGPVAVVRKTRVSGTEVQATELVGDVTGRPLLIADDMVSTGATIEAAARVALSHGAARDVTVAAVHARRPPRVASPASQATPAAVRCSGPASPIGFSLIVVGDTPGPQAMPGARGPRPPSGQPRRRNSRRSRPRTLGLGLGLGGAGAGCTGCRGSGEAFSRAGCSWAAWVSRSRAK